MLQQGSRREGRKRQTIRKGWKHCNETNATGTWQQKAKQVEEQQYKRPTQQAGAWHVPT
jgi:hypothetical protein